MKNYSISQRNKSRGSKVWYGRTFEDGVLIEERSLKTTSRTEAKAWLDVMNASRFTPSSILYMTDPENTKRRISECCMEFLRRYEGKTLRGYGAAMALLTEWCSANKISSMGTVKQEKADLFMKSLVELKNSTKVSYLKVYRTFFTWAIDNYGMDMKNPFTKIKPPKVIKREKPFWTPEEIDKILDKSPSPRYRLFYAVMAFAGLRYFEAVQFGPSMISGADLHLVGKGGKDARVPISDRLKEEIARTEIYEGMFVGNGFGNPVTRDVLKKMVERAGLPTEGCNNHKFRHSFVSNVIRNGVDASIAQRLARHSNIQTTVGTYTHLLEKDLHEAINKKKEGV